MKKVFHIFSINLLILIFLIFFIEFSSWIVLSLYYSSFFSNKSSISLDSSDKKSIEELSKELKLGVLDVWNDVQKHIAQKFENIGLPPELVKGVKQWMASIDETRMYFTNALGEAEYFPGSKIEDLPFDTFFSEQLTDDEALGLISRVLSKYKKSSKVDTDELDGILNDIKEIASNATSPEDRALVEYVTGGFYDGVEQAGLNIAEEIGLKTGGRVPYGYRGKSGTDVSQRMKELGLSDLSDTDKANQLKNLSIARQEALERVGTEVAKLPRRVRQKTNKNIMELDGLETSTRNITDKIESLRVQIDEIAKQFKPNSNGVPMTWDNYGEWHIDHIKPCASFDLTCPIQQKLCFLQLQSLKITRSETDRSHRKNNDRGHHLLVICLSLHDQ